MPFTYLSDSDHRCPLPKSRDDGSPLVLGDMWQCDKMLRSKRGKCGKSYVWSNEQREGNYWSKLQTPTM